MDGDGPLLVLAGGGKRQDAGHRPSHRPPDRRARRAPPVRCSPSPSPTRRPARWRRRVEALLAPVGLRRRWWPPSTPPACACCGSTCAISAIRRTSRSTTRTTARPWSRSACAAEGLDDKSLTPGAVVQRISAAKNQMLTVADVDAGRPRSARGAAGRGVPALPGAPGGVGRGRLRRPAAPHRAPPRRGARRARLVPRALAPRPGGRVPGHQPRAVRHHPPARRRAPQRLRASATTTSRSTAGAAPTSATSSTSSATIPGRASSGWSRTTAPPSASWRRPGR